MRIYQNEKMVEKLFPSLTSAPIHKSLSPTSKKGLNKKKVKELNKFFEHN
jgi:hypothetical protein